MGCLGIGISLLQYETLNMISLIYLYHSKIDKKFKNNELSIWKGLWSYIKQAINMTLVDWHSYILWDSINFIIGLSGDKAQLATYSLDYNIIMVVYSLMFGLNIFTRTQLNIALGIGDYRKFKSVLFKQFKQNLINIGLVIIISAFIIHSTLIFSVVADESINKYIRITQWFVYIACFQVGNDIFSMVVFKAFDHLFIGLMFLLLGDTAMILVGYYLGIAKGYGLVGVMTGVFANLLVQSIFGMIVYFKTNLQVEVRKMNQKIMNRK